MPKKQKMACNLGQIIDNNCLNMINEIIQIGKINNLYLDSKDMQKLQQYLIEPHSDNAKRINDIIVKKFMSSNKKDSIYLIRDLKIKMENKHLMLKHIGTGNIGCVNIKESNKFSWVYDKRTKNIYIEDKFDYNIGIIYFQNKDFINIRSLKLTIRIPIFIYLNNLSSLEIDGKDWNVEDRKNYAVPLYSLPQLENLTLKNIWGFIGAKKLINLRDLHIEKCFFGVNNFIEQISSIKYLYIESSEGGGERLKISHMLELKKLYIGNSNVIVKPSDSIEEIILSKTAIIIPKKELANLKRFTATKIEIYLSINSPEKIKIKEIFPNIDYYYIK